MASANGNKKIGGYHFVMLCPSTPEMYAVYKNMEDIETRVILVWGKLTVTVDGEDVMSEENVSKVGEFNTEKDRKKWLGVVAGKLDTILAQ